MACPLPPQNTIATRLPASNVTGISINMSQTNDNTSHSTLNMAQTYQLPRLSIGMNSMEQSRPPFLELIPATTFPFQIPSWCTRVKPRAVSFLDVHKNHQHIDTYPIDQRPMYFLGRNEVSCNILLDHCSISRNHAIICHHISNGATYIVDLNSSHGTYLNGNTLRPLQPTLLKNGSNIKFGLSTRTYYFRQYDSHEQISEYVNSRGLPSDERILLQNTIQNRSLSYNIASFSPTRAAALRNGGPGIPRSSSGSNMAMEIEDPQGLQIRDRCGSTSSLNGSLSVLNTGHKKRGRNSSSTSLSSLSTRNSMDDGIESTSLGQSRIVSGEESSEQQRRRTVLRHVQFREQPVDYIPPAPEWPDDSDQENETKLNAS